MTTKIALPMVEINLQEPTTPPAGERQQNIAGTDASMPFIDNDGVIDLDALMEARQVHQTEWAPVPVDDGKPHVRYFAVGPSTHQVHCPLCQRTSDTETVEMAGILGRVTCLLSVLSCCFPIFSLSFVYCCLQSRFKTKRIFCNKCGGHLGFYRRPT